MCGSNPPEDTKHPVEGKKTMSLFKHGSVCRDLAESDFTTCGKELVFGVKPRRFVKEGANARRRHCYREALSVSQAGSVPDNDLSLKVPLPGSRQLGQPKGPC